MYTLGLWKISNVTYYHSPIHPVYFVFSVLVKQYTNLLFRLTLHITRYC
jgi:hypothetical protein